jgi:alcohol dehydrogenase
MYFHASGASRDTEETLRFAAFTGTRPMIEQAPLAGAQPAHERMLTGRARFRMVLVTTH